MVLKNITKQKPRIIKETRFLIGKKQKSNMVSNYKFIKNICKSNKIILLLKLKRVFTIFIILKVIFIYAQQKV